MTGGAGFSTDAMKTSRSNRANRTSSHAKFKDGQKNYLSNDKPLKFKEVSDEELARIKGEIQERAKKERTKGLIIGLVVGTIVLLAGLYLML